MSQPSESLPPPSLTEVVARRVRDLRTRHGWSARELADRCAAAGMPGLDRSVIANLENGRRRDVSIQEAAVLARVLDVALVHLLALAEDVPQQLDPVTIVPAPEVLLWARGDRPLTGQDETRYLTESYATPAWEAYRDRLRAKAAAEAARVQQALSVSEEDTRRVVEPMLRELVRELRDELRDELGLTDDPGPSPDAEADSDGQDGSGEQ